MRNFVIRNFVIRNSVIRNFVTRNFVPVPITPMSDLILGDPWLGLTHHNPELQTGAEYSAGLYPGSTRLGSFAQHHNLQ
jgi:hypothetical protein